MIEIIGPALNQWDTGRSVKVTNIEADHFHFANKGDLKAVVMKIADTQTKIPDYLLQTGKQLCVYAVKDGVTVASITFFVNKRERPEHYVYEDDDRNYIYELISNAEKAVEDANQATENANLAAAGANASANNANTAAGNSNQAAGSANEAAKKANEAAEKAAQTAKSLMVVGKTDGVNIHLDDAIEQYLVGLRIFGKTTQAGVPAREAPVEIVSVGDGGRITVNVTGTNDAQSMTITTPNGLPGIPITTGGNYADENGQLWACDEIDFTRGVYVQRVYKLALDTIESWRKTELDGIFQVSSLLPLKSQWIEGLCTHFRVMKWYNTSFNPYIRLVEAGNQLYFEGDAEKYTTVEDWTSFLTEQAENGTPVELLYVLATPIETPLSTEELAAYAALHTYRDHTTVSNDSGAYMELQYVMDAKKYIDSLLQPTSVRIAQVKLLASAWVGSGNLYSQVVSIDGVTKNSQVNLTPSIQQLSIFYEKDITFSTENNGGVVTVYVIGEKPVMDYTIQADIVEVIV